MLLSVIIPAQDAGKHVPSCLEAVSRIDACYDSASTGTRTPVGGR